MGSKGILLVYNNHGDHRPSSSKQAVDAILNFLSKEGIIRFTGKEGYIYRIIQSKYIISLRSGKAGFWEILKQGGSTSKRESP